LEKTRGVEGGAEVPGETNQGWSNKLKGTEFQKDRGIEGRGRVHWFRNSSKCATRTNHPGGVGGKINWKGTEGNLSSTNQGKLRRQ